MLKAKGWEVRNIKVDGGCYEVYALDEKQERVEAYFHPVTLERVKTAERVSAAAPSRAHDTGVGPAVRVLHWSLVLTVAAAWLTRHSPGGWHEWLGYATLAIVVARTSGASSASGHARFASFVRPARRHGRLCA